MANDQEASVCNQDPALAFLERLIARIQSDQVFCTALDACVSRGDANGFFALLEQSDLDPDGAWELDDDWLEGLVGGRGGLPLALVLLAGSLGAGHGLQPLPLAPLALPSALRQPEQWLQHALPLIRRFEGLALEAYLDPVGVVTIGYGSTRYPDGRAVQLGLLGTDAVAELHRPAIRIAGGAVADRDHTHWVQIGLKGQPLKPAD